MSAMWSLALAALLLTGCGVEPGIGLVARLAFDEVSGVKAVDVSGTGNDGEIRNASRISSPEGGALLLDGSGDSVVLVPVSPSLAGTRKAITLSAWAYRTDVHNVALVAHAYPVLFFGFHRYQFKWQLSLSNGRGASCYADAVHRAELGRWYHMAATYNGWVARLFVDGREVCSDWTWGDIALTNAPFTIGAYLDAEGSIVDEMSGLIDDVRVYDRALASGEIEALFLEGQPRAIVLPDSG